MSNVINMGGGGTSTVTGTIQPGCRVLYSDGDKSDDLTPTTETSVSVLAHSIVYAPYGLTGGATELDQPGFWLVTDDFGTSTVPAEASITAKSGVTYTKGISDLTPDILAKFAAAISNTPSITNTTDIIYCDFLSYHREITVGNTVPISMNDRTHDFRVIGFNYENLTNPAAYGSTTYTGKAGITFEMVDVYSYPTSLGFDFISGYAEDKWYQYNWKDLRIATFFIPGLKDNLPAAWKQHIKPITHLCYAYSNGRKSSELVSEEIFVLALGEIADISTGSNTPHFTNRYRYYLTRLTEYSEYNKYNSGEVAPYWFRNIRDDQLGIDASGWSYCTSAETGRNFLRSTSKGITDSKYVSPCFCL